MGGGKGRQALLATPPQSTICSLLGPCLTDQPYNMANPRTMLLWGWDGHGLVQSPLLSHRLQCTKSHPGLSLSPSSPVHKCLALLKCSHFSTQKNAEILLIRAILNVLALSTIFIWQIFTEHFPCARHRARHQPSAHCKQSRHAQGCENKLKP